MALGTGLGAQAFVDQYDLSGDVSVVDRMAMPSRLLDFTAISLSAVKRGYAHVDGELAFTSFFDDGTDLAHTALKAKGAGADRVCSYLQGSAIGNMAFGLTAKQVSYDGNRGADGSLVMPVQCLANGYGANFTEQLTAGKRTDSTATNGASLNNGAATAFGLIVYVHLFAFAGTSVTIAVQESSDNAVGDPFANILATSALTTPQAVVLRTATLTTAVEQYLRVVTTGTLSNAVFAVHASRYAYAV